MTWSIIPFDDSYRQLWDDWCAGAVNGTFLHTRRFLSYHGSRFADASVMVFHDGRLAGVLPAALAPGNPKKVVSHPGATYGGVVHNGRMGGEKMLAAMRAIVDHYRTLGVETLLYKVVPNAYAQVPSQDDLYALFRLRAQLVRRDLSSTIDLSNRLPLTDLRKRSLKKALKQVTLSAESRFLPDLWNVLSENLARKHEAKPVHSMGELRLLIDLFPENISIRCALQDENVVAGIVVFHSPVVWHAQYIASSEVGYDVSALDAVFAASIEEAGNTGARYFDFGISNESGGLVLNEGLYNFKSGFGGGGMVHDFYEVDIACSAQTRTA